MTQEKQRLDLYLYQKGLAPSRQKAKEMIEEGHCLVDGKTITKAGTMVKEDAVIEITGTVLPYVSRGGWKLEKALNVFDITLENRICLDIGASTGGFTDCMLQHGAGYVYAVDSGQGQLADVLREDLRVCNMEGFHVKHLTPEALSPEKPLPDFASVDVSFISLTKVLQPLYDTLDTQAEAVCLIKPQFEAGPALVGKKGVVKDPRVHKQVIRDVLVFSQSIGFSVADITFSPIKGPEGNIEFLVLLQKGVLEKLSSGKIMTLSERVVVQAHQSAKG